MKIKQYTRRAAIALAGLSGLAFLAAIPAASLPAMAAEEAEIHVAGAWARASIGELDRSAAYFEIVNHADAADRLVGAKTDASEKAELHATMKEGDVMRMRPLGDGVDVPAKGAVKFEPAGKHVMLIGLKEPLKEGMSFPLTLVFEKAGEVRVDVAVRKGAPDEAHGHRKH